MKIPSTYDKNLQNCHIKWHLFPHFYPKLHILRMKCYYIMNKKFILPPSLLFLHAQLSARHNLKTRWISIILWSIYFYTFIMSASCLYLKIYKANKVERFHHVDAKYSPEWNENPFKLIFFMPETWVNKLCFNESSCDVSTDVWMCMCISSF